ncbi:MAG: DUF2461 family protein [Acidimicrobiales bacterium]
MNAAMNPAKKKKENSNNAPTGTSRGASTSDPGGAGFTGFPTEGLDFLEELGRRDKPWFDANRSVYNDHVVAPTKAFVVALGERLADGFAPGIVALPKTNGSIAPINNDLRFSPDKNPYKDHLMLRFWEGANKKTAPTLMLRIGADDIGYAIGVALPSIDRWRELIDDDKTGSALADALAALGKRRSLDIAGQDYKKVPKPYPEDHPRADLLRQKGGFQARWIEPTPKSIGSAKFVDHCMKRLERCSEVHRWMVANLA